MTAPRPPKETRRHPRFTVDVEAVVHATNGRRLAARTRDLSRSGICLITSSRLQGNEALVIELVLSFGNNAFSEPLKLKAHVVWCTAISKAFQVGAMFDHLSPDNSDFLDMFLHYLDGTLAPEGVLEEESNEPEPERTPPPDVKDDPFRK